MYAKSTLTALLAAVSTAQAVYQGFNSGASFTNGQVKSEADFEAEFKKASSLAGTDGAFTSVRLYTMIQGGSVNDPISAIPAAIKTKTSIFFGLWASAGSAQFANEIAALRRTIEEYGDQLDGLIAGISVGSEDLYRISPTGQAASPDPGATPDELVNYISQVRDVVEGTSFAGTPIGHVDTSDSWTNSSNSAVVDASDFIGFDTYPYYEETRANSIENAKELFDAAVQRTEAAVKGKPIWVAETGWPVVGKTYNEATASTENAERYWNDVGCPLFGVTNTWYYILHYSPGPSNPDFGVIGGDINSEPRWDLSCKAASSSSSASSASSTTTRTRTATPSATASDGSVIVPVPSQGNNGEEEDDQESTAVAPSASGNVPVPAPSGGNDDAGSEEGDDNSNNGGAVTTATAIVVPSASTTIVPAPTGGNATIPAGSGPTSVEPNSASSMSFSAAFVALMIGVALF